MQRAREISRASCSSPCYCLATLVHFLLKAKEAMAQTIGHVSGQAHARIERASVPAERWRIPFGGLLEPQCRGEGESCTVRRWVDGGLVSVDLDTEYHSQRATGALAQTDQERVVLSSCAALLLARERKSLNSGSS